MSKTTHGGTPPLRSELRAAEKAKARAARASKAPTPKQLQREAARRAEKRRKLLTYAVPAVLVVALIGVAVWIAGSSGSPSAEGQVSADGPPRSSELQPGEVVPDFTAPGLTGGTVRWADHAGEPILLAVWAPWCPHCQNDLPVLGEVAKDYPTVTVMTVVTSVGDQPGPDPLGFMQDNGLSFPTAVDDGTGTIAHALGVQGFPTMYAVGPDGTVVRTVSGELGDAGFREWFDELEALATP